MSGEGFPSANSRIGGTTRSVKGAPVNLVAFVEWAEGYHRRGLYSPIGVAFHWVMAALMIFQLGLWLVPGAGNAVQAVTSTSATRPTRRSA